MGPKKYCGYLGKDGKYYVVRFQEIKGIHDEHTKNNPVAGVGPFNARNPKEALKMAKKIIVV